MLALTILVLLTFAVWAVITLAAWGWKKYKLRKPQSERLFEAGVSRHLVPRLNPYIVSGSHLYIIGGDGAYAFKSRGGYWVRHLENWINRGCTIHYLLCCPDPRSCNVYEHLVAKYPNRFCLHALDQNLEWSAEVGGLTEKYATFHPTLLEVGNGGGRAMWIENYHPHDSEYAFDIEFVSPEDGRSDPRFNEYLRDIKALMTAVPAVKTVSDLNLSAA
jgi:hypothetical protein